VLEPDDGHIGLKHVVRKKTTNCVKVAVKYQQESTQYTGMLHYRSQNVSSEWFSSNFPGSFNARNQLPVFYLNGRPADATANRSKEMIMSD
jgi:hypothetical protein